MEQNEFGHSFKIDINALNDKEHGKSIDNISIWSMCLTLDDRYLFIGQSNGQLRVFDLQCETMAAPCETYENLSSPLIEFNNGITHIISMENFFKESNSAKILNQKLNQRLVI